MNRVTRILHLKACLLRGKPVLDAAGWASELQVDTRSVQRDLAFLRQQDGLPIVYDPSVGGYTVERRKPSTMKESRSKKWIRLMDLIHRITAEPGQTSQKLADSMKCTPRTFFRDIAELQELGLPLYSDDGYRFAADAFLPALGLQPRELLALFLGVRMVESQGGEEIAPDARRAMEKLLRTVSEGRRPDMGAMRSTVQVSPPVEDTGVDQLLALQAVVGNGRQLRLSYLGLHDEGAKDRVVDPMGLFGFRQVWYLRAFDHLRSDFRSFRLSRVVDWESLPTAVEHPAKMELNQAIYHRWDIEGREPVMVELRISESLARWLAENPPHPSQRIQDGRVTYSVSDLPAVARWAASLHGLEVLGPPEMRQEMATLARDLLAMYDIPVETSTLSS